MGIIHGIESTDCLVCLSLVKNEESIEMIKSVLKYAKIDNGFLFEENVLLMTDEYFVFHNDQIRFNLIIGQKKLFLYVYSDEKTLLKIKKFIFKVSTPK